MLLNSKRHIDRRGAEVNISLLFNNTPCLPKHKSTIVLLYNKCMLCISCLFRPLKPLTLRMDHAKLFDVLTSLPVSHAILPRAVCFATSRPANHAICSFIDSSGYAFGPIRICLFIHYIIIRASKHAYTLSLGSKNFVTAFILLSRRCP